MSHITDDVAAGSDDAAAPWNATVARYKHPDLIKSCWQIVGSFLPLLGCWYLMYLSTFYSWWLTLLLAVPTAGFVVRVFIIQHDCGHHSFFRSRRANDVLGLLCGFVTFTPYHFWRRTHARHHVTSGNLNHRGHGDVATLTLKEYSALAGWQQLKYRIYRHPLVMFFVGASYLFLIRQRFSQGVPGTWWRERYSVYATNAFILAAMVVAWQTIGLGRFVFIELSVMVLAAATGNWLFYIQHQYEDAYWQGHREWDFADSALKGSSYYRLPRVLQWFTGNIGFHHIHHLNSRIPNYHLPRCYDAEPTLREAVTLGLMDSFKCASLKLWDEDDQRMITFAEARARNVARFAKADVAVQRRKAA